jgi:hypothetical protein
MGMAERDDLGREVLPGIAQDAETIVEMSEEAWIDFRYEMRTWIALL